MKKGVAASVVVITLCVVTARGNAQHWSVGADLGLSVLDGYAGFHITPVAELLLNRNMGMGSEFSVNTQYGAPLLWYPYFKYYFTISGSRVRPYADAGPVLTLNVPGGPNFGFLIGGGANIPVTGRLSLAPDIVLGPVFNVYGGSYNLFLYGNYYGNGAYSASSYTVPGVTILVLFVRAGVRYEL